MLAADQVETLMYMCRTGPPEGGGQGGGQPMPPGAQGGSPFPSGTSKRDETTRIRVQKEQRKVKHYNIHHPIFSYGRKSYLASTRLNI